MPEILAGLLAVGAIVAFVLLLRGKKRAPASGGAGGKPNDSVRPDKV